MEQDRPLSVTITNLDVHSHSRFIEEAEHLIDDNEVTAEPTSEGLVLRALWEQPLERAFYKLKAKYPRLRASNPEINYIQKEGWKEPYVKISVTVPEASLGAAYADLHKRRAWLVEGEDMDNIKRVEAEVPLSEFFGYPTDLRILSSGKGTLRAISFLGYRPIP